MSYSERHLTPYRRESMRALLQGSNPTTLLQGVGRCLSLFCPKEERIMEQLTQEQREAIAYKRRVEIPMKFGHTLRIQQVGDAVWLDRIGPGNGITDIGWVEPSTMPALIEALVRQSQWAAKAEYREILKAAEVA